MGWIVTARSAALVALSASAVALLALQVRGIRFVRGSSGASRALWRAPGPEIFGLRRILPKFTHDWIFGGQEDAVLIGVDIGGTAVKLGVINLQGEILANVSRNIKDYSLNGVCCLTRELLDKALDKVDRPKAMTIADNVVGIGVCMPGIIDSNKGETAFAANFPQWPRPAKLAESMVEHFEGLRPEIENDANVALLAEIWRGACRNAENVVMITLGTGVGSAIVCDGNLIKGGRHSAGEVGHAIFQRNGRFSEGTNVYGVLEEYVSARAVAQRAKEALSSIADGEKVESSLQKLSSEKITCKEVFEAAKAGDKFALGIVDDTTDILGVTCVNMVRILDTDAVVFGGGMVGAGNFLLEKIKASFCNHYWNLSNPTCDIVLAELGNQAGFVGAAYLAHPDRFRGR